MSGHSSVRARSSLLALVVSLLLAQVLQALPVAAAPSSPLVDQAACTENELGRNDDSYTEQVPLPFSVDFYGQSYDSLWVNNNGNVTFDAPLSTFTPFGLTGTRSKIIAPFFADVDTSSTGSQVVRYGWGTTVYQGHDAFCVNWVDVGYYPARTDKLNSFQLLLVDREDTGRAGDFDIVFNYARVQWESGSASGGVDGLGGASARAGFSDGSGRDGTYYEIPGSGVPGAFLDTSPEGLSRSSTDSPVTGRHVWRVRSGAAPATRYVALGDSYASGEGDAGRYEPGTDRDGVNECHRSTRAYPHRLVDSGVVELDLDFGACSGATTPDLYTGPVAGEAPWDEGPQLDRLGTDTRLVTLSVGGNDVGFGPVLASCIERLFSSDRWSCQAASGDEVDAAMGDLGLPRPTTRLNRLQALYREIRERAPRARILVVGYPRFYVPTGSSQGLGVDSCAGVRVTDQLWINQEIRDLNAIIRRSATTLGVDYVDVYDVTDGHELCSGGRQALNGIIASISGGEPESYHPNAFGHQLLADRIAAAITARGAGTSFRILPAQTQTQRVAVPSGAASVTFASSWPGSDVVMSLRSPSGRRITRESVADDVLHQVGPTSEVFTITSPEAGEWEVSLFGAQVASEGEPTVLTTSVEEVPNQGPTAVISSSGSGRTVTVDAGGSRDADGRVVQHLWDFGDGATASGPTATHTYTEPGTYQVTLAVTDDDGDNGFAADIRTYTVEQGSEQDLRGPFLTGTGSTGSGPFAAGSPVAAFFSVAGRQDASVLAAGSPTSQQVDCTSGAGIGAAQATRRSAAPSYEYEESGEGVRTLVVYGWRTESRWRGQCRELTITLDDGSSVSQVAVFR